MYSFWVWIFFQNLCICFFINVIKTKDVFPTNSETFFSSDNELEYFMNINIGFIWKSHRMKENLKLKSRTNGKWNNESEEFSSLRICVFINSRQTQLNSNDNLFIMLIKYSLNFQMIGTEKNLIYQFWRPMKYEFLDFF